MKSVLLVLLSALFLTACGAAPEVEDDGSGSGGANKPGGAKNIQAGEDLIFYCLDNQNGNTMTVVAHWETVQRIKLWNVSLEEKDAGHRVVLRMMDMSAYPAGNYSLVFRPSTYFQKISQTGSDTATLEGIGRTLSCKFQ